MNAPFLSPEEYIKKVRECVEAIFDEQGISIESAVTDTSIATVRTNCRFVGPKHYLNWSTEVRKQGHIHPTPPTLLVELLDRVRRPVIRIHHAMGSDLWLVACGDRHLRDAESFRKYVTETTLSTEIAYVALTQMAVTAKTGVLPC